VCVCGWVQQAGLQTPSLQLSYDKRSTPMLSARKRSDGSIKVWTCRVKSMIKTEEALESDTVYSKRWSKQGKRILVSAPDSRSPGPRFEFRSNDLINWETFYSVPPIKCWISLPHPCYVTVSTHPTIKHYVRRITEKVQLHSSKAVNDGLVPDTFIKKKLSLCLSTTAWRYKERMEAQLQTLYTSTVPP
jgi:hypothetical protein